MLPLVLCSIFTVAISLERFIRLKKSNYFTERFAIKPRRKRTNGFAQT
jgi:biopolymer transport protein ExbB